MNETKVEDVLHKMESNGLEVVIGDNNRLLLQESLQSGNTDSHMSIMAPDVDLCTVQAGNGVEMLGNKVVSKDANNWTVNNAATQQEPLKRGLEQDEMLVDGIPPVLMNRSDKGWAKAPILLTDLQGTSPVVEVLLDVPASADVSFGGVPSGLVQPVSLPDPFADGRSSSVPSSIPLFSEVQQAQLQSQILVLGTLSKGLVPDETLTLTAVAGTGVSMVEGISCPGVLPSNLRVPNESVAHRGLETTADIPSGEKIVSQTGSPVAPFSSRYQNAPSEAGAESRVGMDKHLQQAQATAREAVATATSALAQSHVVWTRMQSLKPSDLGADLEAQIASVAATVAAAASVAKAAVEVAKAISEAWKKAFAQFNATHGEALLQVSTIGGGLGQSDVAFGITQPIEGQPMQASVVDVLGKTGACSMDGEMNKTAKLPVPKKGKSYKSVQDSLAMNGTPNKQNDQGDMLCKKKPSKKAPSKKNISIKGLEVVPGVHGDDAKRFLKQQGKVEAQNISVSGLLEVAGAAHRPNSTELGHGGKMMNTPEAITVGSLVEVMSEEEGLRGGWFSGKVLMLTEEAALVAYDELLNDDGCSNLKEWFPRKESQGVTGPKRQIRPMHPISSVRGLGSRKRLSSGCQVWLVGDHVDAFIQDGWWEGVVREVNDVENKVTVYFPGEQDLAVVKPRILRPSLNWTEGKWRPCTDFPVEKDIRPAKQQKVGSLSSEDGKRILPPSHSTDRGNET